MFRAGFRAVVLEYMGAYGRALGGGDHHYCHMALACNATLYMTHNEIAACIFFSTPACAANNQQL